MCHWSDVTYLLLRNLSETREINKFSSEEGSIHDPKRQRNYIVFLRFRRITAYQIFTYQSFLNCDVKNLGKLLDYLTINTVNWGVFIQMRWNYTKFKIYIFLQESLQILRTMVSRKSPQKFVGFAVTLVKLI